MNKETTAKKVLLELSEKTTSQLEVLSLYWAKYSNRSKKNIPMSIREMIATITNNVFEKNQMNIVEELIDYKKQIRSKWIMDKVTEQLIINITKIGHGQIAEAVSDMEKQSEIATRNILAEANRLEKEVSNVTGLVKQTTTKGEI